MEVMTNVSNKEATMTSDEAYAELSTKTWYERKKAQEKANERKKKERETAIRALDDKLNMAYKVKGVTYMISENNYIPSTPPYTTWSGLMITKSDSPFAERLKNKCGGIAIDADEKLYKGDWRNAANIAGYWTAPEDWPEMSAGREDPTPCCTPDYPKQSFQLSWK